MDELTGLAFELKNISARKDSGDDYLSMNSKYSPILIESKNFHDLSSMTCNMTGSTTSSMTGGVNKDVLPVFPGCTQKKILFIDGGNTLLFESASFCIGFIRVGGITYSNNKRTGRKLGEFYILVNELGGKYCVKTYPKTSFDSMIFDPEDDLLKTGVERCSSGRIVSVIRRFAELEYAANHCKDTDYIIMDGTLEARYPYEEKYLDMLLSSGRACALSKTCTLATRNGFAITKKLLDLGKKETAWYYYPIVTSNNPKHLVEIYFIRLNLKSDYVFRFEIQKKFVGNAEELLFLLASNSIDPVFRGYPYGLIDVDQYVRVSDDESRLLQTKLSVKLGKDWHEFSKNFNSMNAHSILDTIKF